MLMEEHARSSTINLKAQSRTESAYKPVAGEVILRATERFYNFELRKVDQNGFRYIREEENRDSKSRSVSVCEELIQKLPRTDQIGFRFDLGLEPKTQNREIHKMDSFCATDEKKTILANLLHNSPMSIPTCCTC
ncbi:hypothetical protein BpHYR1_029927 [Brachionus plicatilis]|uniref:Uncharacterized protein n=1 Tax=Brachionus plicatilis TaxID=10195 RepID=A0A3M7Q6C9_BRAPC|nr:hypothetical protein BpHYR1_029927 [Brachionus plicatilis]